MKKPIALLIVVLLTSVALAQTVVISPRSIVVNPVPSFDVAVSVDKDSSGQNTPSYQIGEPIQVSVRVSEDAFVYLYSIKSNGEVLQIFPNRFDSDNFQPANQTRIYPPQNARYSFNIDGPRGLDKVIAVASKESLNTRQLADFQANGNFASSNIGEEGFASAFSIVVSPINQNDWVTDTALFYVGGQPQAPAFGTLDIGSNPSGAEAYIDGQFVGYTPVRYGTRPGQHDLRLELSGYDTFSQSINLRAGDTQSINAQLSAVRSVGQVTFRSDPGNAEVFVDGQFLGATPTGPVTLNEGSYQATFRLPGFGDEVVSFTVSRNSNQTVSASMRRLSGTLAIQANVGGAQAFINGNPVGTIPSGTGRLTIGDLPPGSHELTVVASGFATFVGRFQINPGSTSEVTVRQGRL